MLLRRAVMPSKRDLVADITCRSGALTASRALETLLGDSVRILAYHRSSKVAPNIYYEADIELVSTWESEFAWQMEHVAAHYSTPSPSDVFKRISRGAPLPKRSVLVTFDDGFMDNFEVAYPILRRLRIPAMFFLTTGYIETMRRFWFDEVVSTVLRTSASRIRLDVLDMTIEINSGHEQRRGIASRLLAKLKTVPNRVREAAVDEIRVKLGAVRSGNHPQPQAMSWDQVREMASGGMEFGSHTVSHPVLSRVERDEDLAHELTDSKSRIEAELGSRVTALAYPVGGRSAYDTRVISAARSAGYKVGVSYVRGATFSRTVDPFEIRRIAVERDVSRPTFMATLASPRIFV